MPEVLKRSLGQVEIRGIGCGDAHFPALSELFLLARAKRIDFVSEKGNKLYFFEVKYQEKVSAAEFRWLNKIKPKTGQLTVVTKQDSHEHQSINLVPVPIFLIHGEHWGCC